MTYCNSVTLFEYRFVGKVLCADKTVIEEGDWSGEDGGGGGCLARQVCLLYCCTYYAGFSRLSLSELGELLEFH